MLSSKNSAAATPYSLFPEHHLSHAASAFYPSPFSAAAILTLDGVGEWATCTIGVGRENGIEILREFDFPHSLGLLYSAFTAYCGFKVNSGEYKLMGLAPYGTAGSPQVEKWKALVLSEMVDLREDGSSLLNMEYFNYATGLTMCVIRKMAPTLRSTTTPSGKCSGSELHGPGPGDSGGHRGGRAPPRQNRSRAYAV